MRLSFIWRTLAWRRVQVMRKRHLEGQIRLLAADIGTLPFAEGSLSAVVTQYVMDFAGNPLRVAAEIQRVLKASGIRINFSNPFKLPGDSLELAPPEPSELAGLFAPLGLDMIKAERRRFTLWNVDKHLRGRPSRFARSTLLRCAQARSSQSSHLRGAISNMEPARR